MSPLPRRALLGGALAAALPLAPATPQPQGGQSVAFLGWTSSAFPTLHDFMGEFTRATGILVRHQELPWPSYRTAMLDRLRNGPVPDVVMLADTWLAEAARSGLLAPLDDIPELARQRDALLPFCRGNMALDDHDFGVPYYSDHMAFLYNREMLGRAGIAAPPTSWEEVAAQSRQLQARGVVRQPLTIPLAPDPWLVEVVFALAFAFGGSTPAATPEAPAARPMGLVLEFLRRAMAPGGIMAGDPRGPDELGAFDAMAEGRAAFALLPSYRLVQLNQPEHSRQAGAFRTALMPNGGSATAHETCGWVRMYAMTAAAKADPARRDAATAFMAAFGGWDWWTAGYSLPKRLMIEAGLPPCYPAEVIADAQLNAFIERYTGSGAVLRDQHTRLRSKPIAVPWFTSWQTQVYDTWTDALAGRVTVEAAMRRFVQSWESLRQEAVAGRR